VQGDKSKPAHNWVWLNNGSKKDKKGDLCKKKYFVHKSNPNLKRRMYSLKTGPYLELVHILESKERRRKRSNGKPLRS
jgi:hypothetical protein